jgi:cyclic beta-1,2-glucan synthetase
VRLVARYAPIAEQRGQRERAARWHDAARGWRDALQAAGWDGEWYRRAFFDDGTPLGSHLNAECRIDLIAQSWAVLSGAAPEAQARQAMAALDRELVDREAGLVRLLDPPLAHASRAPATSRPIRPACARTAASTRTPASGR